MTTIDVTVLIRTKHADLYAAAKKLGSQRALAQVLGERETLVGDWINFQSCPPVTLEEAKRRGWAEARWRHVASKLIELTGKLPEDLFPPEVVAAVKGNTGPKQLEHTVTMETAGLLSHARDSVSLVPAVDDVLVSQEEEEQQNQAMKAALKTLSYRERKVLELRFGLADGVAYTADDVAFLFNVSRARVHQIESGAIRKLQQPSRVMPLLAAHPTYGKVKRISR